MIAGVDSGDVVVDEAITTTAPDPDAIDIDRVLSLEPGRYRATIASAAGEPDEREIGFTVVR